MTTQSVEGATDDPAPVTQSDIRATIAKALGVAAADIDPDDNLVLLGVGSLEMMQMVNRWKRDGLRVDFRALAAKPTLRAWTAYIGSRARSDS